MDRSVETSGHITKTNIKEELKMFDSVNRMEGTSIDWSQLLGRTVNTTKNEEVAYTLSGNDQGVLNKDELAKELEKTNNQLQAINHSLRMKFNEDAEEFYVEVVDIMTKEVLSTIPENHVLELAAKLKDMVGFFIDEKR